MELNSMWIGFNIFVVVALYFDLFVLNKKSHIIGYKEALFWTIVWTILALVFNGLIYLFMGADKGTEFLTSYLIERALSFDNMFVFILIFSFFNIPQIQQPRVLKWGIIGALIMRLVIILVGIKLLDAFHWMIYVFGALLLFTGLKMLKSSDDETTDLNNNLAVRALKRIMPVKDSYHGEKFFIRENGKLFATPLLVVLFMIESSDLIFAIDSVPAILAITQDTFIVYSSNVFAIFGLRAMYFLLADLMNLFKYLKYGLSCILVFIGVKMLITDIYHIPVVASLLIIMLILAVSILFSVYKAKQEQKQEESSK